PAGTDVPDGNRDVRGLLGMRPHSGGDCYHMCCFRFGNKLFLFWKQIISILETKESSPKETRGGMLHSHISRTL
ncbi:MAG TPA: hypothetical protein PK445_11110, partial [Methanolinea sp.]|nr:hypothetical protein [Methanolinea sp.]